MLLAFPIVTAGLGIWQLARLRQKQTNLNPQTATTDLSGVFLPQHVKVGPRAYPVPYTKSATGFYIVQAFLPHSSLSPILVNRGWLPRGDPVLAPSSDTTIAGFYAKSERVGQY